MSPVDPEILKFAKRSLHARKVKMDDIHYHGVPLEEFEKEDVIRIVRIVLEDLERERRAHDATMGLFGAMKKARGRL